MDLAYIEEDKYLCRGCRKHKKVVEDRCGITQQQLSASVGTNMPLLKDEWTCKFCDHLYNVHPQGDADSKVISDRVSQHLSQQLDDLDIAKRDPNHQTKLRDEVLLRDKSCCLVCEEKTPSKLECRHIVGWGLKKSKWNKLFSTYQHEHKSDLEFDDIYSHRDTAVEAITLCHDCHSAFDRGAFYFDSSLQLNSSRASNYNEFNGKALNCGSVAPLPIYFALHEIKTRQKAIAESMCYCPCCYQVRTKSDLVNHKNRNSCS